MILTVEQLKRICLSGRNLVVRADAFTIAQLSELAAAARDGNAGLTNASWMLASQLEELAQVAPHLMTLDLTERSGD